MKKYLKGSGLIAVLAIFLAAGFALAADQGAKKSGDFPEIIKMKNEKAYKKHRKAIVEFSHMKHFKEYEVGCGECHHDEEGKPLKDLEVGDDVQSCLECHKPGRADRRELRGLSPQERKKEEVKYHYGAIHENCQGCHEDFNKEKVGNPRKGPAPVSCSDCHPREEGKRSRRR